MGRILPLFSLLLSLLVAACAQPHDTGSITPPSDPRFYSKCDASEHCSVGVILRDGPHGLVSGTAAAQARRLDERISEARIPCGRECILSFFVDFKFDRISHPFFNVVALDTQHELVAATRDFGVTVERMFDRSNAVLTIKKSFALSPMQLPRVQDARFADGRVLRLTYLGADGQRQEERVSLDIAALPPIELPPTPRTPCCAPASNLTKYELARNIEQRLLSGGQPEQFEITPGDHCVAVADPALRFEDWVNATKPRNIPMPGTRVAGAPTTWRFDADSQTWSDPTGVRREPPTSCFNALRDYRSGSRPSGSVTFWRWTEEVLPKFREAGVPAGGGTIPLSEFGNVNVRSVTTDPDGTATVKVEMRLTPTREARALGLTTGNGNRMVFGTIVYRRHDDGWHYESGRYESAEPQQRR